LAGEVTGDQAGLAYSIIGRLMALYVCSRVSLSCPKEVPESAFNMLLRFEAFAAVVLWWVVKVSMVSKVKPRIFGLCSSGRS